MANVTEVSGQVIRAGGDDTGMTLTYTWQGVTQTWRDVALGLVGMAGVSLRARRRA